MARQRKDHARGAAHNSPPSQGGARGGISPSTVRKASQHTFDGDLNRRLRCEPLEDRRLLAVITVTTVDDSVDFEDGVTSLREAIFATNTVPGADEIRFDPALFAAGARTILLTHGELAITDSLTITGPGADLLTIDASGNDRQPNFPGGGSRVLRIDDGSFESLADVSISGLRLTGGDLASDTINNLGGGAILTLENLTLSGVTVENNRAWRLGGGLASFGGDLIIDDCIFRGNVVTTTTSTPRSLNGGGAIFIVRGATSTRVAISHTTIEANAATFGAGLSVVSASGEILISHCTIIGNTVDVNRFSRDLILGGGVYAELRGTAAMMIQHTSITENTAGHGGGVYALIGSASLVISDSSITNNRALVSDPFGSSGSGGGVRVSYPDATSPSTNHWACVIHNSTIAGNVTGYIRPNGSVVVGGDGGGIFTRIALSIEGSLIANNAAGRGGGLYAFPGTVRILSSTLEGNQAQGHGGAIMSSSLDVRISSSTIRGNLAGGDGGGIAAGGLAPTSAFMISESTIDDNHADGNGGAISSSGLYLSIAGSTLTNNSADQSGGALHISAIGPFGGEFDVVASTLSGNTASLDGGAVYLRNGDLDVSQSTIARNAAGRAGGGLIFNDGRSSVRHTIVANNDASTGADMLKRPAAALELAYSLVGEGGDALLVEAPVGAPDANGNLIGGPVHGAIDPLLGPLADNGGPTLTHALLPGSPAINAGDPAFMPGVGGAPEFDQRGAPFTRLAGERIDIGAFEVQAAGGALWADFNLDGFTDGADFLVWQRNVGRNSGATLRQGDATADGDVDGNDLAVWRARAGVAGAAGIQGSGFGVQGGGEADSAQGFAAGLSGAGEGGVRSTHDDASALAGVRAVGFAPVRREEYRVDVARERDAAIAGIGATSFATSFVMERAGTPAVRRDAASRIGESTAEAEEGILAALDLALSGMAE